MPHKEEISEFKATGYPPFPKDLPVVELQTISLVKLLDDDAEEQERVFQASKDRGFFYLELGGCKNGDTILQGCEEIARTGEKAFRLPLEEKKLYAHQKGTLFGYKQAGMTAADKAGARDTAEFFNVGKNDMIVDDDDKMQWRWPAVILEERPLFREYVKSAHSTGMLIMNMLARKLGADPAEMANRHRIEELAGDHVRITRGPPRETEEMPEIQTPSHTDFGTITILMNWLGGLQVWSESSHKAELNDGNPDSVGEWLWVRPRPGCAIVNMGDAAVTFSNGVLCSGRHRVVPAPGAQGMFPRYSIVYFVRPEDDCIMKQMRGTGIPDGPDEGAISAREWIQKQAAGLGVKWDDN